MLALRRYGRLIGYVASLVSVLAAAVGCTQLSPQQVALATPVRPSEIEWARQSGNNTVSGTARIAAANTAHTCAGQSANLIPDSAYARARLSAIFGNTTKGMRAASLGPVRFERDDPLYVTTLRTTRCDGSGSFAFPRVPDGIWYVTTSVRWDGPSQAEGGSMMQRVDLRGGRLVKVALP
ncbi:MAG: hypothetical protein FJX11_02810 [Alphaproteobacteria bacterium]|nr:hypothetical protein [Alphaproteobacteria bacterium]